MCRLKRHPRIMAAAVAAVVVVVVGAPGRCTLCTPTVHPHLELERPRSLPQEGTYTVPPTLCFSFFRIGCRHACSAVPRVDGLSSACWNECAAATVVLIGTLAFLALIVCIDCTCGTLLCHWRCCAACVRVAMPLHCLHAKQLGATSWPPSGLHDQEVGATAALTVCTW